jgi:hypothetical protein
VSQALGRRVSATGGRFLGPVCRYRLRCDGTSSAWPVATGPVSSARGPTYLFSGRLAEVSRPPRHSAIGAASYFRDGAVMQAGLFGDFAEREARRPCIGESSPPSFSDTLRIPLESGLGLADGHARGA